MRAAKFALVCAGGLVSMSALSAGANDLAADNASNYLVPPGWVAGSNGGYGFTPWSFLGGGNASATIATGTPVGLNAWDLDAADDGSAIGAIRGFSGFNTNASILLDMDLNNVASNGAAEVAFQDSDGNFEFEIFVQAAAVQTYNSTYGTTLNPDDYIIQDNNPADSSNEFLDTGIADNGQAIHIDLKLLDGVSHAYSLSIEQQGGASYNSPVGNTLFTAGDTNPTEIDEAWFINQSAGTPLLFNNFIVVPMPAAAMSALPLLGLLAATKLKRR